MAQPQSLEKVFQEGRIELAVHAIRSGQISSIRKAAQTYDVPRSSLQYRILGRVARLEIIPLARKLTPTEESVLIQQILDRDQRGTPPTATIVREMADLLLVERVRNTSIEPNTVGKNWVYNFVQRHPELQSKYNRKYDYQRAKCEDPKIISGWFVRVQQVKTQYGIPDEDIYNFDETGFMMGVISTAKVITGSEKAGRAFFTQPGNREWVTVIECINSCGWATPPLFILEGKVHISTWYKDRDLPYDWAIGVSENGWTNNELGMTWLRTIFNRYTKDRTKGRYRLLILDGHGNHVTSEFEQFCAQNDIIPLCMPAHSSHLLQPLDVGCFSTLKSSYGQEVASSIRLGINHVDKQEFLSLYQPARTQALSSNNIRSGFAATGLVPFDPNRVLSQLHIQLRTPSPPIADKAIPTAWVNETPHTLHELQLQADAIKGYIQRRTTSPPSPTNQALTQLVKGCQMAMQSAALLASENSQLRAANNKQKRKREATRSYVAHGGVLTVAEGLQLAQGIENEQQGGVEAGPSNPKKRAPSKCSMCKSEEHNARTCPHANR